MKVIVIGSKGFIGQALFEHFKQKKVQVCGADIISEPLQDYFFVNASSPDFDDIFQQQSFDYCINASGAANVNFSVANPAWDYELNTHNVFRLLHAIRKFNPACRFLQISSAAVYGNPASLPVNENAIIQPLSPYGFHKWQSELLCREFSTVYGVLTSIVRIFSAYGPGLRKQLFWDLYQKSLQTKEIELSGTGNESRDFIYIQDIVEALEKVMLYDALPAQVVNIASGVETTVKDAVEGFFHFMHSDVKVKFNGLSRAGDPLNWRADISKLKETGFKPMHSFLQGLKQYCEWLKSIEHPG